MNDKVYVFDTTLRDGEQVPGCQLNTVEKIEVAIALEELGVDIIEAGFPISSPGDFNSIVEVSKVVRKPVICALTRAVQKDIECAADALKFAERSRIHTGIGSSDIHILNKLRTTREDILERAAWAAKFARNFTDDVEFFCEDAGRADLDFLAKMVEIVIANGATVVNIPDTTGYCLPEQYYDKIHYLMNNVPNIDKAILSVHCHNDLGLATANTIAGLRAGARQVEVTINGIGERAGNTALEEVALVLKSHEETLKLHTDINIKRIYPTSRLVTRLMKMPVQPNKAIVGRNAFSHSSGIHQDGVLKSRENYEIIDPQDVGIPKSLIVLTARSGRAALKYRIEQIGFTVSQEELDVIYAKFLDLADTRKEIYDEDLLELLGHSKDNMIYSLSSLTVSSQVGEGSQASVVLVRNQEEFTSEASGNGPVDAALKAIDKIVKNEVKLEEYLVQAITGGSNDVGKVHIQISVGDTFYYGFGADTDIVLASAKAYIDALNKL